MDLDRLGILDAPVPAHGNGAVNVNGNGKGKARANSSANNAATTTPLIHRLKLNVDTANPTIKNL